MHWHNFSPFLPNIAYLREVWPHLLLILGVLDGYKERLLEAAHPYVLGILLLPQVHGCVYPKNYGHFHLFMAALALVAGPFDFFTTPPIRAQKDFLLLAALLPLFTFPVTGAFSLDPVCRLCFALPLAVNPAPLLTGNFSPRPTLKLTLFLFFFAMLFSYHGYKSWSTFNIEPNVSGPHSVLLSS